MSLSLAQHLRINGAGKFTTKKMLTGDLLPTSGRASLGRFDVWSQQQQVRRLIRYCPRSDAHFDVLTVREHLELFAHIKGVAPADLDAFATGQMRRMHLSELGNTLAGTSSGGKKRKLCVVIAMLCSPRVIFLDEPSTGMNSVSRRTLWNVIAEMSTDRKESTIVLTTHNVEECEALCTRVGIMVDGRLRCLGSGQHLKNCYGDGLKIEIKLNPVATSEIPV